MIFSRLLMTLMLAVSLTACDEYAPALPIGLSGLRALFQSSEPYRFTPVSSRQGRAGETRALMHFTVDGLKQYALVVWPVKPMPEKGWPVLLFNHGFHPDPANHGKIEGQNARPGAYYWELVHAYLERGYVVIAPDYRGHNVSEGFEFTQRKLAPYWYTRDVIAAYIAMTKLDNVDTQKVYMAGHSMGGGITQRALLALGDKIKAASIWSTSGNDLMADLLKRDLGNAPYADNTVVVKPSQDQLSVELTSLQPQLDMAKLTALYPLAHLQVPLTLQHGVGDKSTDEKNSRGIAAELYRSGKAYQLFIYETDQHLFTEPDFSMAVNRDIEWFESHQ
jgi:dipeptidyl aminopeptidase/acylaminoacyl peptidase